MNFQSITSVSPGLAVTMPAANQNKMRQMGWEDAVEGRKEPRFSNMFYMEGWNNGKKDLGT